MASSGTDKVYDVCVVGAGMIGSAAARHASLMTSSVCLIGPSEPKNKSDQNILGSWFDEGRLARQMYTHPSWATIAQRAASNYRQMEEESGIPFFTEVGCLSIMQSNSTYLKLQDKVNSQVGIEVQKLSREEAKQKFPYLNYTGSVDEAWFEEEGAGYVNPRRLVEAEQTLAKEYGCTIIDDVVTRVAQNTGPGDGSHGVDRDGKSPPMEVITQNHGTVWARKVLLATGAFTEYNQLLPEGVVPHVSVETQTVILAEVSEDDQKRMKDMPPMMYNGAGHEVDGAQYLYTYILPPIRYPDGKVYLKIGHMDLAETYYALDTLEDIHRHYQGPGVKVAKELLLKIMAKLFPDFHAVATHTDTCVTTHTVSGIVFIDLIHPQLGVAIGGNGTAGKSCDELGRMAADLIVTGRWNSDMPPSWFKFQPRLNESLIVKNKKINYANLS